MLTKTSSIGEGSDGGSESYESDLRRACGYMDSTSPSVGQGKNPRKSPQLSISQHLSNI